MEENKRIFSERKGVSNLITPIAIVMLLTGVAVWLVPDDDAGKETKKPLPKLGSVIRPLDSSGSVIRPIEQEVNENDAKVSNGGVISRFELPNATDARTLIAKMRQTDDDTGQEAFEEAERQRSRGNNADAYLLYFFAAKQGHGEAAMMLGTQSDPTYYTSINSALDEPDPGQAIKWYRIAIAAGKKDAKHNLAELSRRIKQQAEAGSGEAQRLMLQLQ
jgi:TPR repeat protein